MGIFGSFGIGAFHNPYLFGRDCIPTHPDILGPYWSENHPYRSILANSEEPGTRIFISGTVTSNDCETPICNAIVDVWHANDEGCYTVFQDCESGNSDGDEHNLRGIIITDENGYYAFESILPGKFKVNKCGDKYSSSSNLTLNLLSSSIIGFAKPLQ